MSTKKYTGEVRGHPNWKGDTREVLTDPQTPQTLSVGGGEEAQPAERACYCVPTSLQPQEDKDSEFCSVLCPQCLEQGLYTAGTQ